MKISLFLLAISLLMGLIAIVCGNENKEKTQVVEALNSEVRVAEISTLCRTCFRIRRGLTRRFIRSKGCPRSHRIGNCVIRLSETHVVRGLRCVCRPGPRPNSTPSVSPTNSPTPLPSATPVACNDLARSGGQGTTAVSVELGQTSGTFSLTYNHFVVPDQVEVFYEGAVVFTTGGLVSGSMTVSIDYGPGTSTSVTVVVSAPRSGTAWEFVVNCPER